MKHKVLFDGNGSSLIRVVGLGDYVPVDEAQALAAQVEALRGADAILAGIANGLTNNPVSAAKGYVTGFGAQHLAEIRAEAVVSFLSQFEGKTYWNKSINDFVSEGYQYAEQIRQGGVK